MLSGEKNIIYGKSIFRGVLRDSQDVVYWDMFGRIVDGIDLKTTRKVAWEDSRITDIKFIKDDIIPCSIAQYLRLEDSERNHVFNGDILELMITEDLMDKNKELFYNSSIGKAVAEFDLSSVLLVFDKNNESLIGYSLYFKKDGKFLANKNEDSNRFGKPTTYGIGDDVSFPKYLIEKGAKIVGNAYHNHELLEISSD